ncbi:MAG: site-2 protease family protein [Gemmatimonadetes bacterium]|nr:site-2 protease family protein [Gemmatimonadota bacterium]
MDFLLSAPILLMSIVVHEVAHAWQARREGDFTADRLGRITLNPIRHIDPFGSVLLPLMLWFAEAPMMFGWAKPVPVDPRNFRDFKAGDIRVSLAGIVSNLLLAVLFTLVTSGLVMLGGGPVLDALRRMFLFGIFINLVLAFFNLIPIPPLDGSHVLYQLLPPKAAEGYRRIGRWGFLVILVLVFAMPGVLQLLLTPVNVLMGAADWFIRLWI